MTNTDFVFFEHSNYDISTEKPKYLAIITHGYGANGSSILEIAKYMDKSLPATHFIAPNAPNPWEGGFPDSYQWFSLSSWGPERDATKIAQYIIEANNQLRIFIKQQLNRFNLTYQDLFLFGFSQGAMMAIYQGLTAPEKPAGIVSFSGKVILPEIVGEKTLQKPDICLMHGRDDMVLPFENFTTGEKILQENGFNFKSYAFSGLDHTIDLNEIRIASEFIRHCERANSERGNP